LEHAGHVSADAADETKARVARSFDAIADLYTAEFVDELGSKPFDRNFLEHLSIRLRGHGMVWEVGAGPAHVGGFMAARGASVVASDISEGQAREARALGLVRSVVRCDLEHIPAGAASLDAVVAFYCLIYAPTNELGPVFADWRRVLAPRGLAILAFHGGAGEIRETQWRGRDVDITVVLHDPDEVVEVLNEAGFVTEECTTRDPYPGEYPTKRCYVVVSSPVA
jgi:uncharacterized protein